MDELAEMGRGLPPGPRRVGPVAFVRSLPDPTDLMLQMRDRYGDTYTMPTPLGPVVVTGDPEGVRALFTADPDTFLPYRPDVSAPMLGETSLALVSGARHRRDRKLLTPPFHGARMRAYGEIMADSARRAAASWEQGRPFKMLETTQEISMEVILEAVFGLRLRTPQGEAVRKAVSRFVGAIRPQFIFFQWMRRDLLGLSAWARFKRAREELDSLLFSMMAERRAQGEEREDILSLMMSARYEDGGQMSDMELRDQLMTLLFAGHEATAIGMAWAFYWLHRQPEELGRLLADLDGLGADAGVEAIAALPSLDAVCQEALRIHPVTPEILRVLARPFRLLDWTLPAGTAVMASAILVHRREDLYPEATLFRPSRFLSRKPAPFEHIPFGGGARRCIGAAFGLHEMKVVLGTILRSHKLRLASSKQVKPQRRGFTMGPKGGVPMICEGAR
ncbi:MAG: cytochrome P450 [Polyangiaceae bacterium]